MAGDQLSATTQYYYQNNVTNTTGNNLTNAIVTSLIESILGSPATNLAKGNTTNISNQLNANTDFLNKTAPDANNPNGSNPKAYLSIVFFNERFEYVSEGSTALRVAAAGDGQAPLVIPNIKVPKNGFAYIYLSNESNEPVYFDNFTVADTRGRIIEEDHYYAFGLKIAGISSKKFGDPNEGMLDNKNLYNDKELFDDADLDWYDYGFRNYDPQIGRFPQLDPLTDEFPYYTPYQYAGDEPIANVDLDGLEPFNAIQTLSEVVVTMSKTSGTFKLFTKVAKMGGNLLTGAVHVVSSFVNEVGERAKVNIAKDIAWVKSTANTLNNNAKTNWGSGNTIVQQFGRDAMANPLSLLDGGAEANVIKGALGMEIRATGRQLWTSSSKLSSVKNAIKHWKDHRSEFPEFLNAKQYVEGAKNFMHNSPAGTLTKTRANGDILKYHQGTNTFGVMDASGVPRTMFRPTEGMQYWLKQK